MSDRLSHPHGALDELADEVNPNSGSACACQQPAPYGARRRGMEALHPTQSACQFMPCADLEWRARWPVHQKPCVRFQLLHGPRYEQ